VDAKHKSKGYTHKVDAVIHPKCGGDDYEVTVYYVGEPSKPNVERLLARTSCVTDQYSISAR